MGEAEYEQVLQIKQGYNMLEVTAGTALFHLLQILESA